MSEKTLNLSNLELQVTQKIQLHFPRGVISPAILTQWDNCPAEVLRAKILEVFGKTPCPWRETTGAIYFSVTSDGTTGARWVERLKEAGYNIGSYAKSILLSEDFKPTSGIVYNIAVLKGMLFEDNDRITENIRAEAEHRDFGEPNAEVACLIRIMFSDEDLKAMGLKWIITMHEPIKDSDGGPGLLGVDRDGGGHWLRAYYGALGRGWGRARGFAFVVSQVAIGA